MDEIEAIHILETMLLAECHHCPLEPACTKTGTSLCVEAVEISIKNNEKQIPKKLIPTEYGLKCPSCNVMFLIKYDRNIFCQECGQKLDWSV